MLLTGLASLASAVAAVVHGDGDEGGVGETCEFDFSSVATWCAPFLDTVRGEIAACGERAEAAAGGRRKPNVHGYLARLKESMARERAEAASRAAAVRAQAQAQASVAPVAPPRPPALETAAAAPPPPASAPAFNSSDMD